MDKKTLKDIDVKGKKVFVRVDYNVPFDENQNITNDTRMVRTLPTINYLLDNGAAVILACHIGRPTEAREPQFSTKHLVAHLSELLGKDVKWASDCVGEVAEKAAADLKAGEVLLLENLRYHKAEKKNDPEFAKQLASLADVAVEPDLIHIGIKVIRCAFGKGEDQVGVGSATIPKLHVILKLHQTLQ